MGAVITWPWRVFESLVVRPWRLGQSVDLVVFELNGPWVMEPWRGRVYHDLRFNYDPRSRWPYERLEGRFVERTIASGWCQRLISKFRWKATTIRRIRIVSQYENDFDPGDAIVVEQNLTPSAKSVLIAASWTWSLDILVAWIVTIAAAVTARKPRVPLVVLVPDASVDAAHLLRPADRIRLSTLRRVIVDAVPDVTDDLLFVATCSASTAAWALNDAFEFIYAALTGGRVRWRRTREFPRPSFVDRVKMRLH